MYSTYTCQQKIWTRSRARSWKITTVKKLHEALQIDSNLVLIDLSVLPQRLASRTGVIFWCFSGERKQAGSERDVQVTTKGRSANLPPHTRDSLFALA